VCISCTHFAVAGFSAAGVGARTGGGVLAASRHGAATVIATSHYNQRARVEGQFARWKQVIGDGLRFHSDEARVTEVAIAAAALNRMLDLGCPNSVRVA
jgi:hypothetical protein